MPAAIDGKPTSSCLIPISSIRKDGKTQHRAAIDTELTEHYAALMRQGVVFPPVRVWWDGADYWLTDGFHRIAAAELAGLAEFSAVLQRGSLETAQWDSYAANSTNGMRRTGSETQNVIRLALLHPRSADLSNVQIAKHLQVPEATVRRWRRKLSSSSDEDELRLAVRGNRTYRIRIRRIGKHSSGRTTSKTLRELRCELEEMKAAGTERARRVLTILGHWAFGRANPSDCLGALESLIREWPR